MYVQQKDVNLPLVEPSRGVQAADTHTYTHTLRARMRCARLCSRYGSKPCSESRTSHESYQPKVAHQSKTTRRLSADTHSAKRCALRRDATNTRTFAHTMQANTHPPPNPTQPNPTPSQRVGVGAGGGGWGDEPHRRPKPPPPPTGRSTEASGRGPVVRRLSPSVAQRWQRCCRCCRAAGPH